MEINWKKYSYTEKELKEAVASCFSARAAMKKLGLAASGSGYKSFIALIEDLSIDKTHWLGQAYLKGKNHSYNKKLSLDEILVENRYFNSYKLKNKLLKEGIFDYKCFICFINEWNGKRLALHLDHINGNNHDNRIENLRLLCPNCHSQTETYAGKNKKPKK